MKTSLNNTKRIEDFLMQRMDVEEATLFRAKLLLDPELKQQVHWQRQTYKEVEKYGRRKLMKEISVVHDMLFSQPQYVPFRRRIFNFFGK